MRHHHPLGETCENGVIVHDDDSPTHDLTHRLNQHIIYDHEPCRRGTTCPLRRHDSQ